MKQHVIANRLMAALLSAILCLPLLAGCSSSVKEQPAGDAAPSGHASTISIGQLTLQLPAQLDAAINTLSNGQDVGASYEGLIFQASYRTGGSAVNIQDSLLYTRMEAATADAGFDNIVDIKMGETQTIQGVDWSYESTVFLIDGTYFGIDAWTLLDGDDSYCIAFGYEGDEDSLSDYRQIIEDVTASLAVGTGTASPTQESGQDSLEDSQSQEDISSQQVSPNDGDYITIEDLSLPAPAGFALNRVEGSGSIDVSGQSGSLLFQASVLPSFSEVGYIPGIEAIVEEISLGDINNMQVRTETINGVDWEYALVDSFDGNGDIHGIVTWSVNDGDRAYAVVFAYTGAYEDYQGIIEEVGNSLSFDGQPDSGTVFGEVTLPEGAQIIGGTSDESYTAAGGSESDANDILVGQWDGGFEGYIYFYSDGAMYWYTDDSQTDMYRGDYTASYGLRDAGGNPVDGIYVTITYRRFISDGDTQNVSDVISYAFVGDMGSTVYEVHDLSSGTYHNYTKVH